MTGESRLIEDILRELDQQKGEARQKQAALDRKKLYAPYEESSEGIATAGGGSLIEERSEMDTLVKEKMASLRENDYTAFHWGPQPELMRELAGKSYLEQLVILEQGIQTRQVDLNTALEIFTSAHHHATKLAVLENINHLSDLSEENKKRTREFLSAIALNYFDEEGNVEFDYDRNLDYIDKYHIDSKRRDSESIYDDDIFVSEAIRKIGELGGEAEDCLIEIFKKKYAENQEEESTGEEPLPEESDRDSLEYETDGRGGLRFPDEKKEWDKHYVHNALIVNILKRQGTERAVDFSVDCLIEKEDISFVYSGEMRELMQINPPYAVNRLAEKIKTQNLGDDQVFRLIIMATDLNMVEEMRSQMNAGIIASRLKADQSAIDRLKRARAFITPPEEEEGVTDVREFYSKVFDIGSYQLNELMQEKEKALLSNVISERIEAMEQQEVGSAINLVDSQVKELVERAREEGRKLTRQDIKVLEQGIGKGRIFLELEKQGFNVDGFDGVEEYVEAVNRILAENGSDKRAFVGNWLEMKTVPDESYDITISLGRNILHEYSLSNQVKLFREAARVLKKGGRFVFDVPDREKGVYKQRIDDYKEAMAALEVTNFREGAIHDAPHGIKKLQTRYVFSDQDILELARLSGFRVVKGQDTLEDKNYYGSLLLETGAGDENLYYVLEKVK